MPGEDPRLTHRPRTSRIPEVRGELDGFVERLTLLGATADEVFAVIDRWDQFDEEWTPESRKRTSRATDAELVALLLKGRVDYVHDTTPDDGEWQPGMDIPPGSMVDLLAWVGSDPDRASAVYQTERERDEYARTELLHALEPLL